MCRIQFEYLFSVVQADEIECALCLNDQPVLESGEQLPGEGLVLHPDDLRGALHFVDVKCVPRQYSLWGHP